MVKAIGVILIATLIFILDYHSIKNTKVKRDKKVYIGFFLIALCLVLLLTFQVKLPYPLNWVKQGYQPIVEPFNDLLREHRIDKS